MFQNDFFNRVLAPETYLDRFLFQNGADSTNQISISSFLVHFLQQFHLFINFPTSKNQDFFPTGFFLRKNDPFSTSITILCHLSLYHSYRLKISPIFHSQGTLVFQKSFFSKSNHSFGKITLFSTSIIIPPIFP